METGSTSPRGGVIAPRSGSLQYGRQVLRGSLYEKQHAADRRGLRHQNCWVQESSQSVDQVEDQRELAVASVWTRRRGNREQGLPVWGMRRGAGEVSRFELFMRSYQYTPMWCDASILSVPRRELNITYHENEIQPNTYFPLFTKMLCLSDAAMKRLRVCMKVNGAYTVDEPSVSGGWWVSAASVSFRPCHSNRHKRLVLTLGRFGHYNRSLTFCFACISKGVLKRVSAVNTLDALLDSLTTMCTGYVVDLSR